MSAIEPYLEWTRAHVSDGQLQVSLQYSYPELDQEFGRALDRRSQEGSVPNRSAARSLAR